jgi:hypothetical protein
VTRRGAGAVSGLGEIKGDRLLFRVSTLSSFHLTYDVAAGSTNFLKIGLS